MLVKFHDSTEQRPCLLYTRLSSFPTASSATCFTAGGLDCCCALAPWGEREDSMELPMSEVGTACRGSFRGGDSRVMSAFGRGLPVEQIQYGGNDQK